MKFNPYILLVPVAGIFSCGSPAGNEKIDDKTVEAETTACYRYATDRDTITLQLSTVGHHVTGELVYDWAERDRNSGTLNGDAKGDTLVMDYIFRSEGMESVREEVFLKKDGNIHIGYGEAEERGNKWVYSDHGQLKFDELVLKPVDCK